MLLMGVYPNRLGIAISSSIPSFPVQWIELTDAEVPRTNDHPP
jgi:hypothetical protein